MRRLSLFLIALLTTPALAAAVTLGQVDDFQDGTLQGWASGGPNPNPPIVVADQGPDGAGDWALVATANGTGGAGGRLVIFNSDQWTGDYLAAGVIAVGLDLLNLGMNELTIRLTLRGPGFGDDFSTRQAAVVPAAPGSYQRVVLSVLPGDLEFVGFGDGDVLATLADVTEVRILHAVLPARIGDIVAGQVAIDNITAVDLGPVFLDGFESGDTAAWSSATP